MARPKTVSRKDRSTADMSTYTAKKREMYQAFVAHFVVSGNATEAALHIGTAPGSARSRGYALQKHPYVQQLIREHQERVEAELKAKTSLTVENVVEALRRLVMADPRKLFNADGTLKQISELDDDTASMVSSFEVEELYTSGGRGQERTAIGRTAKVKMWDKNSAIDKAMKHLGLFEKDNRQKPAAVHISADDAGVL